MRYVTNESGDTVVLNRTGEIAILDARGRELEKPQKFRQVPY